MKGSHYDAAAVREASRGRWRDILTAMGIDLRFLANRHGPCPGCGGKNRFRFDDKGGSGSFFCGGGGNPIAGDGFGLLRHTYQWTFSEALSQMAQYLNLAPRRGKARPRRRYEGRHWRNIPTIRHAALVIDIAAEDRRRGRALSQEDTETERQAAKTLKEFLSQGGCLDE